MTNIIKITAASILALMLQMCTATLPDTATSVDSLPKVSPDYTGLVIPANIAPLNFNIDEKGDAFITRIYTKNGDEMLVEGKAVDIDIDGWHRMLNAAKGDTVFADVYVKGVDGWRKHRPICYHVAEEIDPYISYRHIEPLYMNYDVQTICQRNLENFDIEELYNNSAFLDVEGDRQCINCHSYQDYNRTGNMQMHIRVKHGGTMIAHNGELKKVNLKVGPLFSAGAYLSWHPKKPIIAYSINDTWQHFHTVDNNKVEVQDAASGLTIYDVEHNTVKLLEDSQTELETFPYWSPDGDYLYYISAKVPLMNKEQMANYRMNNYKDIKYNIYRKPFDQATGVFGATDTVFDAASLGLSATFPREHPNGRYMVFTLGEYGTFHNFHHDADLYLMDKTSGLIREISEINSPDTESYHSWSSNGAWLLFSSRRDNGSYTRLYLTHFDGNGNFSKPFILPQRSPFTDEMMFKSYNVPEFMVKPVEISRDQWIEAVKRDAIDAIYAEK